MNKAQLFAIALELAAVMSVVTSGIMTSEVSANNKKDGRDAAPNDGNAGRGNDPSLLPPPPGCIECGLWRPLF